MSSVNRTVCVCTFEYIDSWDAITDRARLDELARDERLPCTFDNAKKAFTEAGWKGDGELMAFWIPPFMLSDPNFDGVYIWHVKQSYKGTSWLCGDLPYDFPGLDDYDGKLWQLIDVPEPPEKGNEDIDFRELLGS